MASRKPKIWTPLEESDDDFQARYDEAQKRGQENAQHEVRAKAVRYDVTGRTIVLTLSNELSLAFPTCHVAELAKATDAQLGQLEVTSDGIGLSCRPLDVDLSVEGLVIELLGDDVLSALRRRISSEAGAKRSSAKAAASRANGAKGGRPKKSAHAG